jgi:hypothetical protein
MDNGYILLSRGILDSDVFASQKLLKIWVWCLCKANFKDKSVPLKIGKGETVVKLKRGSFIFGRNKAEDELFIDGSTIYKSIQKLKDMDMIEIKSNNQFSIITICNYDTYQNGSKYKVTTKEQPSNNQVTSKEQPSNTTNNYNNVNKDKKEILDVWLNYRKEIKKSINNESTLKTLIDKFNSEPLEKVKVVVNNSIENQWQGLFWNKYEDKQHINKDETIFERIKRIEEEARNGY